MYGSGFPKSQNVSKAIDKQAGATRKVIGKNPNYHSEGKRSATGENHYGKNDGSFSNPNDASIITAPATEAARQWSGWGTALKPAHEPIVVARKRFKGSVAQNVVEHGTGAINIDGCRVGSTVETWPKSRSFSSGISSGYTEGLQKGETQKTGATPSGRFPANLIHDGSDEVLDVFPDTKSAGKSRNGGESDQSGKGGLLGVGNHQGNGMRYGDSGGSAARFFYTAKANKRDRTEGGQVENNHPTVKPTELMRYLVRLVTPPNGTVLDPFMGSGSTGKACMVEDLNFIGIELDADYFDIAEKRIQEAQGHV